MIKGKIISDCEDRRFKNGIGSFGRNVGKAGVRVRSKRVCEILFLEGFFIEKKKERSLFSCGQGVDPSE